ncbi:MAG: anti-sigma factor [Acidobacteria bacterium]|nr:anti-sigma factor [Acidobacteriota bacterium]
MTHGTWLAQLDAYLDGELESRAMQELDRHLRECPECAAESLRRLQWKRSVQSAGRRYTADASLRERVRKGVGGERSNRFSFSWRWASFAAVAAMVIVGVGGFFMQESSRRVRDNQVISELVDLHVSTLASASPVDVVSTDRHTVKPWFEGKIPFSFNLPELQGSPFELIGGRVSYLEQSAGAELIYRVRKHQISVFIFQERAVNTGSRLGEGTDARSFHLESWAQGGLRYFVVGDVGAEDLRALRELLSKAG